MNQTKKHERLIRDIKLRLASKLQKVVSWLQKESFTIKVPPNTPNIYRDIHTECTYEAAYYMNSGAYLKLVEIRKIAENRASKRGYRYQWRMFLTGVNQKNIDIYRDGRATARVLDIKRERLRIKKIIKNQYLHR